MRFKTVWDEYMRAFGAEEYAMWAATLDPGPTSEGAPGNPPAGAGDCDDRKDGPILAVLQDAIQKAG